MFVTTTNIYFLLIREWLNGGLFPLSFMLALILFIFMVHAYMLHGKHWMRAQGASAALPLFFVFAADATRAGLVWLTLRITNDGGALPQWLVTATNLGFMITGFMLAGAIVKLTHQFSPKWLGHTYWVASVLITIIFLLISHLAPPFAFTH